MEKFLEFIKRKQNLSFFIFCVVLVVVMYGSSLGGSFVNDDRYILQYASNWENPLSWYKIFTTNYFSDPGLYRPITVFSYALNFSLFGSGAWSFHLINLILYFLTGYILFIFLKKLFKKPILAGLSAFIFLILPIHTEVVANIIGRAEIFALLFSLLCFWEILKKNTNKWMTVLWFLLALGSKETAIAILPIILLLILNKYKKNFSFKGILTKKNFENYFYPIFVAPLIYFSTRLFILGINFFSNNAQLTENPLKFFSLPERIFTALKILSIYVFKTLSAVNLCSDYSYNQIPIVSNFFNIGTFLGFSFVLFSVWGIFYFFKKKFSIALALAFFLFPYLIISNLILPIGTIAGERLFYFPSIAFAILLAEGILFLWSKRKDKMWRTGSLIFLVFLSSYYIYRSFDRSLDWINEERLFISAGQCAPQSVLSLSNLATVYYFKGDYKRAEEIILDSYKIYDGYTKANNNLGLVYWKIGEYKKAEKEYFRAFKVFPHFEGVYENLALLYLSQNDEEKAEKWLKLGGYKFPSSPKSNGLRLHK